MNFNTSLFRTVATFRRVYLHLRYDSPITRQQVIFLAYLVENGHIKDFPVRAVLVPGMSWALANQYLSKLHKLGFAARSRRLWTLTEAGLRYYAAFMEEFNRTYGTGFIWK